MEIGKIKMEEREGGRRKGRLEMKREGEEDRWMADGIQQEARAAGDDATGIR